MEHNDTFNTYVKHTYLNYNEYITYTSTHIYTLITDTSINHIYTNMNHMNLTQIHNSHTQSNTHITHTSITHP